LVQKRGIPAFVFLPIFKAIFDIFHFDDRCHLNSIIKGNTLLKIKTLVYWQGRQMATFNRL